MKLEVLHGSQQGLVFDVDTKAPRILGREPECDVYIVDDEISRHHARTYVQGGGIFIEDLDSTNGMTVNGKPVLKALLSEGSEIRVGGTLLRVSGLAPDTVAETARLHVEESASAVVTSLDHRQADLVTGSTVLPSDTEAEHENRVLRRICEISQLITAERDAGKVLSGVLDKMRETFAADTASILLWSDVEEDWQVHAASYAENSPSSITVSRTIIQEAIKEGLAILFTDAMSDERLSPSQSIILQGISSAICSPLRIAGALSGILLIDRRNSRKAFSPMDLRAVATIGNIVGIFLERERYEAELREKARLAVIGEVIAGLAHYTKNIISTLRLSISSLKTLVERKQYESMSRCLTNITGQERRISNLILDMLSYAKEREPLKTSVDVSQTLESVIDPYRQLLDEKGIRLEFEVAPDTPNVFAEEMSLHRIFLNLFSNALDALKSKDGEAEKLIRVSLARVPDQDAAEIRLRDTGCGIPADKLKQVFAVFYSTKGSQGTGLGLAVVHKTIKEHGGEISVESRENEWTEFRIVLPAATTDPAAATAVS